MSKSKNKKSVAGKVFGWIGIILLVAIAVGVVCYFAVPEFQTYINNSWQDLTTKIQN